MTPHEKQLRAAMAEQSRISGILAEKKREFELTHQELKQRRAAHGKLAAGIALGETGDLKASAKNVEQLTVRVTDLGALVDGIEERLPAATEALRTAVAEFEESLRLENSQLREELAAEWVKFVGNSLRPTLLRMLARTWNRSHDTFGYGISSILNLQLPGIFSPETNLLHLQTQKFDPELKAMRGCAPFEGDAVLMQLAEIDTAPKELIAEVKRQLPPVKAPEQGHGKQFAALGGGARAA